MGSPKLVFKTLQLLKLKYLYSKYYPSLLTGTSIECASETLKWQWNFFVPAGTSFITRKRLLVKGGSSKSII